MLELIDRTFRLILPSPDKNNTLGLRLGTKVLVAMDGTLWSYIHTPVPTGMTFSFNYLDIAKRLETDDFIKAAMGRVINLKDHNNILWVGRISTIPLTLTDQSRANSAFTVEFEGYRV